MNDIYLKLFTPMKALKGLKDLFIHLNYSTSIGYREDDGRKEPQRILECLVMGEGYDAWKRGKTVLFSESWMAYGEPPARG